MHANIYFLNKQLSVLALTLLFVIATAGPSWAQRYERQSKVEHPTHTTVDGVVKALSTSTWVIENNARKGTLSGAVSLADSDDAWDSIYVPLDDDTMAVPLNGGGGGGGGQSSGDFDRLAQTQPAFGIDGAAALPSQAAVIGNYPNPFNPETTVRFEVRTAQQVRLAVYNALGQEMQVLVEGRVEAGMHEARFAAYGLPSGTYFSRLITEAGVVTRTMILAK